MHIFPYAINASQHADDGDTTERLASRVSSGRLRCVEQLHIAWCARSGLQAVQVGETCENRGRRSVVVAGRTAALLVRL